MIRLLSTLQGARRVWGGPILRLLDETGVAFVVGMTGSGTVSAISNEDGQPPKVDGSIDVLDLMAGGTLPRHNAAPAGDDQRQGVSESVHAVLDKLDQRRAGWKAAGTVGRRLVGPLDAQRGDLVVRAARALYEVELFDEENAIAAEGEARERDLEA